MSGWVYCLENESMSGLVKVGFTDRTPEERRRELSAETGVPTPFVVAYAAHVADAHGLEQAVHQHLRERHAGKEFFNVSIVDAIAAIKRVAHERTIAIAEEIDALEEKARAEAILQAEEEKRAREERRLFLLAQHAAYMQEIQQIAQRYRKELQEIRNKELKKRIGSGTPNRFCTLLMFLIVAVPMFVMGIEAVIALIAGAIAAYGWQSVAAERIARKKKQAHGAPRVVEIDRRLDLIDRYVKWHDWHYQNGLHDYFTSQMESIMSCGAIKDDGINEFIFPKPRLFTPDEIVQKPKRTLQRTAKRKQAMA